MTNRIAVLAFIMAGLTSTAMAQQLPPGCKAEAPWSDFDFWIGSWTVTSFADGSPAGSNLITREEGGCVLQENWTSTQGTTGRSLNYYNPASGKWRQLWVSAGTIIDIEGGLVSGAMALEGTITYFSNGKQFPFRGKWIEHEHGTVQQTFHQYDATKDEWVLWFDGLYERSNSQN